MSRENLQLPVREPVHGEADAFPRPADVLVHHLLGQLGGDVDAPGEHAGDGGEELFDALLLHDVAARPGPQGALGIDELVVHGQHEHPRGRESARGCP